MKKKKLKILIKNKSNVLFLYSLKKLHNFYLLKNIKILKTAKNQSLSQEIKNKPNAKINDSKILWVYKM